MHPLGLYLAITDSQSEYNRDNVIERRPTYARVDAAPVMGSPERVSRIGRLAAMVRRRVIRPAGA